MRRTQRIVLLLIVAGLFCISMFAFFQRSLIYLPSRVARIEPQDSGLAAGRVHTITVTTEDGLELRGWHILPYDITAKDHQACDRQLAEMDSPVILYFSGNGGDRTYRTDDFELLANLGCHVFAFDYRGYGDNPGSPTEPWLASDAHAIWNYAVRTRGIDPARLILFGESLGGGVAVRLAAEVCEAGTPPGGLILRGTFSSLVDVAAYHYPWLPVRMLLIDRYPSVERIPRVTCPILHIHGGRDRIVPIRFGRKLFAAAPEKSVGGVAKRFVELPAAGHNDILYVADREFAEAIGQFLREKGVGSLF